MMQRARGPIQFQPPKLDKWTCGQRNFDYTCTGFEPGGPTSFF